MKKLILLAAGFIAGIVVLLNIDSLIGLVISTVIAYAGFHYYGKSNSTLLKLFWGGVLVVGLLTSIFNIPAFVGIVALIGIYYIWKKWNERPDDNIIDHKPSSDPFVNFEKQWDEIHNR